MRAVRRRARLRGAPDRAALQAALQALVERHEALRTTFAEHPDGGVEQRIAPRLALPLELLDRRGVVQANLQAELAASVAQPFDLSRGPLLRATLVRAGAEEHVLLLVMHHIIADGWSIAVLLSEPAAAPGSGRACRAICAAR